MTLGLFFFAAVAVAQGEATDFKSDAKAEAIYKKLLRTLREAETLSYESEYRGFYEGRETQRAKYKAWLKEPNHFRVEATSARGQGGTLVGDGYHMWIYWTGRRPRWNQEHYGRWEDSSKDVYMRRVTPPAGHSIAHQTGLLGANMGMAILNPSRFHGAANSMDRYFDGVRLLGEKNIDGQACIGIEVSFMSHQRSKIYWLAKRDHLPRRLKQIVRVGRGDLVSTESWSNIRLNEPIADDRFRWAPPEGWRQWRRPPTSAGLLKRGAKAPAFDAKLLSGKQTRLSDYRGKIVWLVFWRVG
jgi:outer membrane lipoprotein-sorting protein